jgi:hypothetical protein
MTPGPWHLEVYDDVDRKLRKQQRQKNADGLSTCVDFGDPPNDDDAPHQYCIVRGRDCEDNARLIAAAPDLLAACKQMQASLNGNPGDFANMLAAHRAIDAAVNKAEGASS